MARQPGTKAKDNTTGARIRRSIGRGMGFMILAGLAMGIIAALVLMPAWARSVRAEYDLAAKRPDIEHSTKIVAARARLINAIPHDPVVNERYAKGTVRQDLIHAPVVQYPPKPSGWMLGLADKLAQPKPRRGLFFVACVALAGGMFLFAPPPFKRASRCRQET
jgi:hypothetical protein